LEEFASLLLGSGRVHGRPLGRKLGTSLEAPISEGLGDILSNAIAAQVLEQAATHDLADLGLVVRDELLGDTADLLGNQLLPTQLPLVHLGLALRQADHGRAFRRSGHAPNEVSEKGAERVRLVLVAVEIVQHLVAENQHAPAGRVEDLAEIGGAGGLVSAFGTEGAHALLAGELPRDVDPRGWVLCRGVPGISDEHRDPRLWGGRQSCLSNQSSDALVLCALVRAVHQVVERGKRMSLAAAELGQQCHHGCGVLRLTREAAQYRANMLGKSARKACPGEELNRVPVVERRDLRDDLFERDGELVRVERRPSALPFEG
jgi:hypothetical protein